MAKITCKFGGTSLADAPSIQAAAAIVKEDPERRFVVPSAPGKRHPDDKKVTDLLYGWYNLLKDDLDPAQPVGIITERFLELERLLGIDAGMAQAIEAIAADAAHHKTPDFLASRGEYLNGRLMAALLDATFVDPAEHILFDFEGRLDERTYERLGAALAGEGRFVVPGFYGSDPDGAIKTFSRGGSDVTGAVVARATASDMYENWTDVSGFRMTDPRVVPYARRIEEVTYTELRELSYMGASVIHDEAIFPIRKPGIPIHIRNTKEPATDGTMILADREPTHPVCGIAGRKGFTMINIEKTLMNKEIGFVRRVLGVLEEYRVSVEHIPSGIDTISILVKDEELRHHGSAILTDIDSRVRPDRITLTPGIALIATVGKGMSHHIGVAARLCGALAESKVNLRVIDQGSSEMNIIVGVDETDLDKAVKAIYDAFEEWTG